MRPLRVFLNNKSIVYQGNSNYKYTYPTLSVITLSVIKSWQNCRGKVTI